MPACASKQDVLELATLWCQCQQGINKFNKTVKNSMFFQIEAVSFLFKYGQISHVISFLLRLAPVTPGSALLRLTYLLQCSITEVTECRFLTKWFRRGEQPISYFFL